jgi:hypothetical protein
MRNHHSWLFAIVPLFMVAVFSLVRTTGSLIRLVRSSVTHRLPLQESQGVSFALPGEYDLYVEGRRGTDLSGLEFKLTRQDGRSIQLESAVVRTTVSGTSTVRLKVRSFQLDAPGTIGLNISGIGTRTDPVNRIVIARPVTLPMVGHILGLVVLGAICIGCLVLGGLFLTRRI